MENTTASENTAVPNPLVVTATEDAKQDFEKVSQALHDGGAREAYKVLKEESDKTKICRQKKSKRGRKEMSEQLTEEHGGKEPILPRLSLAFLESNKNSFANYGMYSADKIETRRQMNEMGRQLEELRPNRDVVNDVDATLLNGLAFSPEEKIQESFMQNKDFGSSKLKKFLDKDESDAKEASKLERSDRAEVEVGALLLKDNGKMFDLFDTRFGSQDGDGKINLADMTAVTEMLDKNPLLKDRFTAEEQKALDGLKGVFADPNNFNSERQDSILKHDGLGQFMANTANFLGGWGGFLPLDRYYVTRESIAQGTGTDMATEVVGAGLAGAAAGVVGAGVAEIANGVRQAEGTQHDSENREVPSAPDNSAQTPDSSTQTSDGSTQTPAVPGQLGESTEPAVISEPEALDPEDPNQHNSISYDPEVVDDRVQPLTTIERGDGYWHVARRLLEYAGSGASNARIAALTQALQQANGGKMLHPADDLYSMLGNEQVKALLNS